MNINMLRDIDNDPGFYLAACGADSKWNGAVVYQSSDEGASYQALATVTKAATIGRVSGVLGDFAGGNIPDELNSITVRLTSGSLFSVTFAAFLEGVQQAVIGDEIVYFRNAVLNDNGTYTVSGFLRGRRGTEHLIGTHAAGERFVFLNPANMQRIAGSTADIGKTRLYKAVTVGGSLASTPAQSFTNLAAGLKPYAPVHVTGSRDAAGNLTIAWVRRTRISGEWRDSVDVALGEASEAYQVDILSGETVVRTISATSPTATYTAAEQTTDGLTPGAAVSVAVYQLSEIVGRGYPATASI